MCIRDSYSTEYFGMRGRLGILSEAYSYAPYETRVKVSKAFTESCVNFAQANAQKIKDLLEATEAQVVAGKQREFSLDAQVKAFDKKFTILGFKDDGPFDYEVDFIGDYEPINTTILPDYYVIPREYWWQVNRLRMHGIDVKFGPWKEFDKHQTFVVKEIRKSPRAFQGHQMQKLETELVDNALRLDPEAYLSLIHIWSAIDNGHSAKSLTLFRMRWKSAGKNKATGNSKNALP